jgi:hypothetical protein
MTFQDTANLGLLHRQFSVRRPERVSGHSCFRLESRGHTQHEMGASIAVGRWRRNVRGRHPAFHRSDRCFRSRWTAKAFTRNRGSRVFSYFRDPSTRATQHCGAAAGGTTSSSRSPSSVSTGNPSAAAGATRGFVQGALPLAPAGIEDQLNELHLNPPVQNSPHAIVPDAKATPEIAPAAESEGSATAEAIEVPSAVEGPSPAAPKDKLVTITSAASVRNGPSESADVIGRLTPVLVPPQS